MHAHLQGKLLGTFGDFTCISFDLLKNISQSSNGQFFTVDQLDKIEQFIKNNENIKPVATYHKKYSLLLNSWIYLTVIMLLLGIEWFMRKWGGGY